MCSNVKLLTDRASRITEETIVDREKKKKAFFSIVDHFVRLTMARICGGGGVNGGEMELIIKI